jgi:hypothetical protein
MSARKDIAGVLRGIVPKRWKILDADAALDALSVICLVVSQRNIEPAPNAIGNHKVTLFVFVVDPRDDAQASEDSLDNATDTVLFGIDDSGLSIRWTGARKITYQGHRAYEITIEAMSERKAK